MTQTAERTQTVKFHDDPYHWPYFPWLPLRRQRDSGYEIAVIGADKPFTVFLGVNVFMDDLNEAIRTAKSTTYGSIQGIVDDGWEVD